MAMPMTMSLSTPGRSVRRFQLWILVIVLLAFGLRLYAIDRQDIWGDEAFSIWLSGQPLAQVVAGGADTHPPLYPFLLYLWLRLAGSSPLAVRFLSAIIGTLTVPLVYVLGRFVLSGRTGLLAALLAAVSPVLVYYSQETRMYGLVTLLAAASVYWTARVYREPSSSSARLAYLLATLAAVYTHYYAFFVVLAENLFVCPALLLCRRWRVLGGWLVTQAVLVLAYLPWIAVQSSFLGGKVSTRFEEWNIATAVRIVGQTLSSFGAGLAVPPIGSMVVLALFLVTAAAGLAALLRRRQLEPWLFVAYLLVPLFLAWLVNPIMPFFYPRYLLLIAPAFYLLVGWGVVAIGHLWRPLAAAGLAVLLLASAYGLRGYYTDEAYVKGRYGQMMAYIQENAQPGDGLLLANQLQRPIFEYYRPLELDARFFPGYEYPLEDPRTARDLETLAARHPRLWFVRFGNPAEYDPDGYLTRWLATHGSKAYFGGWGDADLSLYVMGPASGEATAESIQHPLHADLGGKVLLLGYAVSAERVAPGETLLLTLYWQALQPMTERYTVFTHLLDADDQIQAQMDSEPQGGGLPTDRWQVGEIVQDNYALVVNSEAMPGPHVLEVGMYLLETLDRLPVRDPESGEPLGDRVVLGTIQVGE
jgi:mannosyltransferase